MSLSNPTNQCLNCGSTVTGSFCSSCGQKVSDHSDRAISKLVGEFLGNLFFFDGRFYKSVNYLITKPGRMTSEFLEGKRKKFLPPVTLFLFINLIYFFLNPITDYSLSLNDQITLQPFYSETASVMVNKRIEERGVSIESYSRSYQSTSDDLSRTIMILNTPLMAIIFYLVTFWRKKFFYDSLIFCIHFFTFFLFSISSGHILVNLIPYLGTFTFPNGAGVDLLIFIILLPTIYGILSTKNYLSTNWFLSTIIGLMVIASILFSQLIYRAIVFFLTFAIT